MEKNVFLDLMQAVVDKNERKRLRDFIRSPYFNLSEKTDIQIKLTEMAWEWWDAGNSEYWDEEDVFLKIFGKSEPFSQQKLDKLKSSVTLLARQFFSEDTRRQQQHPLETLRWEMVCYRNKELFNEYELVEKKARKELAERQKSVSIDDLFQEYLLENEIAWLFPGENNRKEEDYLSTATQTLDQLWLAARARWSCAVLNQRRRATIKADAHEQLFLRILHKYSDYAPAEHILVQAYKEAFRLFEPATDPMAVLEAFITFVRQHCTQVSPLIRDELEAFAGNFCVGQVNMGNREFLPKHLEIMMERLQSGRIYRNGKILAPAFHSISTTALKLAQKAEDFQWVKSFLDSHRKRLYNHEAAEEMVRYNYANYYFHVSDFAKALLNLKETYRDINFKIVSKILEIKTLIELDDPRADARIEAGDQFFRRDLKIPAQKKQHFIRFISYTRRLREPGLRNSPARIEKLTQEIATNLVAERPWLLQKVNALQNALPARKRKPT